MVSAPYPGLDPDLYNIVTRLNANFPANQHLLAVDEFRARLEALADGKVTTDAPGMVVQDVTLDLIGRAVRIRIYRPAAWAEGGSDSIGKNAKRGPRSEPRVRISNLSEGLSSTAPHGPSHLHL